MGKPEVFTEEARPTQKQRLGEPDVFKEESYMRKEQNPEER